MKKFKNKLQVYGSDTLLEAFAKELEKLDYKNANTEDSIEFIHTYITGEYQYLKNFTDYGKIQLHLPQDWNKALKLAAEKAEEEITEYKGWKVGDTIELLEMNKAFDYTIKSVAKIGASELSVTHHGSRKILSFEKAYGKVYMKVSGTVNDSRVLANTLPTKEKWLNKQRIDKEVKESGLKIGDRGIFNGKLYKSKEATNWISDFSDCYNKYSIFKFDLLENQVCAIVRHDNTSNEFFFKLSDLKQPNITIAGYKMEITSTGVKFGCLELTKADLITLKKVSKSASLHIVGNEIPTSMIQKIQKYLK